MIDIACFSSLSPVAEQTDSVIPKPPLIEHMACDPNKFYAGGDSCFPLDHVSDLSWSLSGMFGRPIRGSCPLAKVPGVEPVHVCANVPDERPIFVSAGGQERRQGDNLRCFLLEGVFLSSRSKNNPLSD